MDYVYSHSIVISLIVLYTSANTLELAEHLMTKFRLRLTNFIYATTFIASGEFNAFELVNFIAQSPCFAHLIAHFLKYAFGPGLIPSAIQGIRDLIVMLKNIRNGSQF